MIALTFSGKLRNTTLGTALDSAVLRSLSEAAWQLVSAGHIGPEPHDLEHLRVRCEAMPDADHVDIFVEFMLRDSHFEYHWQWHYDDWRASWGLNLAN